MKLMTEKKAEDFLEKQDFEIIDRFFVSSRVGVKKALKKVGLPCVMKVSGARIVHKKKARGIRDNVKTYSEAIYEFLNLMRIRGATGVLFQKKFIGKEFLLGIKKTPEFDHALVFGAGGSDVEEKKDLSFRVCSKSFDKKQARKMIKETRIGKRLSKMLMKCLQENLIKICKLVEKYPEISELDINPFTFSQGKGRVVDARIVFE